MSLRRFLGFLCWATILTICVLLLSPGIFHAAPQNSGYRVIRSITLGGEGGWDYVTVDPDAKRIYIPRSTHVMVLDEDSGKLIADAIKSVRPNASVEFLGARRDGDFRLLFLFGEECLELGIAHIGVDRHQATSWRGSLKTTLSSVVHTSSTVTS